MFVADAQCLRDVARHITIKVKRPDHVKIKEFASACREVWGKLDDLTRHCDVFCSKIDGMDELRSPIFSPLYVSMIAVHFRHAAEVTYLASSQWIGKRETCGPGVRLQDVDPVVSRPVHVKSAHDLCYHFIHQAVKELHEHLIAHLSPQSASLVDPDSLKSEQEDKYAQVATLLQESTSELLASCRRTARCIRVRASAPAGSDAAHGKPSRRPSYQPA
jgi:hypothetical protein